MGWIEPEGNLPAGKSILWKHCLVYRVHRLHRTTPKVYALLKIAQGL